MVRIHPGLPNNMPLSFNVIYQDPDVLVIEKPAGLLVHEAVGKDEVTLADLLLKSIRNSKESAKNPSARDHPPSGSRCLRSDGGGSQSAGLRISENPISETDDEERIYRLGAR